MPNVLVDDVYRITTFCRFDDRQNQLNVHYYKCTGVVGTNIADQDAMNGVKAALAALYAPLIPILSDFQGTKWVKDGVIIGAEGVSATTNIPGTRAGDPLAPQLAAVISQRAAGAPSGKRGRYYMPSPVEADESAEGNLEVVYHGQLVTFAAAMLTLSMVPSGGTNTTTWQKQLRYKIGGTVSYLPVTLSLVRASFGTQRRRSLINRADASLI